MKRAADTESLHEGVVEEALDSTETMDSTSPALVAVADQSDEAPDQRAGEATDQTDGDEHAPEVEFKVPDESICTTTFAFDASPNGLIRRFIAHYGTTFSYRPAEDSWMRWDGKTYVTDVKNLQVMNAVRCVADAIIHVEAKYLAANHPGVLTLQEELKTAVATNDEEAKELAAQLRALKKKLENDHKDYGLRCQLETAVRAAANGAAMHLSVPEEQWDGPKHLLNCQNGVVNLRTGELLPHRRPWRFTQITKCDYVPDATIDALYNVLDHLSDSRKEVQEYMQRWIGQAITGEVSAASILYVFGAAQVGKSTLFNSTMYMMGEGGDEATSFASTAKPEAFQKKSASHDEGFHHLRRCRMVCVIEMQGGMVDAGKLTAISGGDAWDSRRAGGVSTKYFPKMSILMTSNKLTVVAPENKGLMERFQPYEVTRPLPKAQRSKGVKESLQSKEGMEAILAWAVRGAIKWYTGGANNDALKAPDYFADELAEYTRDMDTLQGWLGDNIILVEKEHLSGFPVKAVDLYKNYQEYTSGKGMKKGMFYRELAEAGFPRTDGNVRWTLRAGKNAGKSQSPATWVPGLYIGRGYGDYNYHDSTDDLGGNVPLDPNQLIDNGCEGEGGGCTGCSSAYCTSSRGGRIVIPFPTQDQGQTEVA
ncbi:hypothetical protein ASH00_14665 [Arthrobacter sp. Soil782]|uniref:DNA primase family protein n=1 Tax=Arthrobacter sp. Soil782 TaxID=1736410 RepID=UPI0006FB6F15|nr:phage/plasmid primase, P4 family [Arthrobacter sp. Soil782]KRF04343.1 hypothetical protein ASH00_14665 [Arthrobacter sp. Soil782]